MNARTVGRAAFAIGLMVAGAVPASAQEADYVTDQCGYMCHVSMAYQGGGSAMAFQGLAPRHGNLEMMKARLGIGPSQEEAWNAFAATLEKRPAHGVMLHGRRIVPSTYAVDRAKFMRDLWERNYTHLRQVKQSFGALCASLTAEQATRVKSALGYCKPSP